MNTSKKLTNVALFAKTAKRLGLTVTKIPTATNKTLFSIASKDKFYFGSSKAPGFYPESRRWGAHLTGSKQLTQKILKKLGYKTIRSAFIMPRLHTSFQSFFKQAENAAKKFPVILKPDDGLDGRGIKYIANKAILKREMKTFYQNGTTVILQPIISDSEYRILIVNGNVELVHSKDFRSITGDGKTSIEMLLKEIPAGYQNTDFTSMQYELTGHTLNTILPKGDHFPYHIVKDSSKTHYQFEKFPKNLITWAKKLTKDLSIETYAIDLFVGTDLSDTDNYTIIELNSNPGLVHYYYSCNDKVQPDRICEKVLKKYFNIK